MPQKFRFIDTSTNRETEAEAFITLDYTSTAGNPNSPIITGANGLIDSSLIPQAETVNTTNTFFSVTNIPVGPESLVGSIVVSSDPFTVRFIEVSGENRSVFLFKVNGAIQAIKRLYYLEFEGIINLGDLSFQVGDTLEIFVTNLGSSPGSFEARFIHY